ncbi:MAG: sigma-54-dependent transcriptional regulator [Thiohalospira sp.]
MKNSGILYVDDQEMNLKVFKSYFDDLFKVYTAVDTLKAHEILKTTFIKVVIVDQRMPKETGLEFIKRVRKDFPQTIYIIVSAYSDFDMIVDAINTGSVYRFISKPWDINDLKNAIENGIETFNLRVKNKNLIKELEVKNANLVELKNKLELENYILKHNIDINSEFNDIITNNLEFKKILKSIKLIANKDVTVLIEGETGTGKELIARAILKMSKRSDKPFLKINCAALPSNLIESELFGHEKGAFTGAVQQHKGLFESADGGTIFLDEIGELPIDLQARLLHVLQDGEFRRVGSNKTLSTNTRIIAATNRNLKKEIEEKKFRSDLYYRLNVYPIKLPPLRERIDDIVPLAENFIQKFNRKFHKNIDTIPNSAIEKMKQYSWPGNIRELENFIERSMILSSGAKLNIDKTYLLINHSENNNLLPLEEIEKNYIIKVLNFTNWKVGGENGAYKILGLNRTTLIARMKKLGIKKK